MIATSRYTSFFSTHSFYEGVRATVGIMVPVVVAARYDQIGWGLAMAIGSLTVSLTDNAGPIHHRVNGMATAILLISISSFLAGWLLPYPLLLLCLLPVMAFLYSIIGVFGNRAASIGTASLAALTLQLYENALPFWQVALLTGAGGLWYFLLSLSLYRIRPYKLAQQVLGDCMLETAAFLKIKAGFYAAQPNYDALYEALMTAQVNVHQKQETVREILFKTRSIVKESTHTGRVLVMAFLDTIDLFENIMTSQQDYRWLQTQLAHTGILEKFRANILNMATDLETIGYAMQENRFKAIPPQLGNDLAALEEQFAAIRHQNLSPDTVEAFISLRHILNSLHELAQRLELLHHYTSYDKKLKLKNKVEYQRFVIPSYINVRLLIDNLHRESNIFRYAIRMAVGISLGYTLSLLMPLGHSYWILLTVVVILKPAYALTRIRNKERLLGTLFGAIGGGLILLTLQNFAIIFTIMLAAMIVAFSLMRTRYQLSVALLTVYVLLAFYLLQPGSDFTLILKDRLIDTVAGSIIALLVTFVIPPKWERYQLNELAVNALESIKNYFEYMARAFSGEVLNNTQYKWYRKETYVALANLSDAFQRMLNEPKNRQQDGSYLHQLIISCHVLSSHLATLSGYKNTLAPKFIHQNFAELSNAAIHALDQAVYLLKKEMDDTQITGQQNILFDKKEHAVSEKVRELLTQRKAELQQSTDFTDTGKELLDLKTITDQFMAIIRLSEDIYRICLNIKSASKA